MNLYCIKSEQPCHSIKAQLCTDSYHCHYIRVERTRNVFFFLQMHTLIHDEGAALQLSVSASAFGVLKKWLIISAEC